MKTYHKYNFFKYTYCEFDSVKIDFFKEKKTHFKSKSGSYYFYTEEGVFRYSDHWGRVASCRWRIKGIDVYKNQDFYVGFAKWTDFHPLNDVDKVYYIHANLETKQAKILRLTNDENKEVYLMNAPLAHQRLKQIQTLFKEYKWAKYINADIDVLRKILMEQLVSCNTSLDILKRQLKRQFE